MCNPGWITPEKSKDLANLHNRFKAFGRAIGNDNLAVWFWLRETQVTDPRLTENVDVERSASFCRTLQLRPTAGPFLVVTSQYPDLNAFPKERLTFELGGLQAADLAKLLNSLTDELLLEGKVDAARTASSTAAVGLWMRLLQSAQRSMVGFGCRLKVLIQTGLLNAELRECAAR